MSFVLKPPPPCSRLPAPSHPPQLSSSTTSVKPLLNSQPVSASAPGSSYKLLSKHYTNITFYTQNSYQKKYLEIFTQHLSAQQCLRLTKMASALLCFAVLPSFSFDIYFKDHVHTHNLPAFGPLLTLNHYELLKFCQPK